MSEDKKKTETPSVGHVKSKGKGYESLSRAMLQDKDLGLTGIGLLSHMVSMPDNFTFYKTKLYRDFPEGRRAIARAWQRLVDKHYILQFIKRKGSRNYYIYYFSDTPFTREEVELQTKLEGVEPSIKLNCYRPYKDVLAEENSKKEQVATDKIESHLPSFLTDDDPVEPEIDVPEQEVTSEKHLYDYRVDAINPQTDDETERAIAQENLNKWKQVQANHLAAYGTDKIITINDEDYSDIKFAVTMSKIKFTTTTLSTQAERFNRTLATVGINPKGLVDYFMRGLYQLQAQAIEEVKEMQKAGKDMPKIPMHNWTIDTEKE